VVFDCQLVDGRQHDIAESGDIQPLGHGLHGMTGSAEVIWYSRALAAASAMILATASALLFV
jgi:hypothetical protein